MSQSVDRSNIYVAIINQKDLLSKSMELFWWCDVEEEQAVKSICSRRGSQPG